MTVTWLKRMLPGMQQQMWETYRLTGDLGAAAAAIGVSRWTVQNWVRADGGIPPRRRPVSGDPLAVRARLSFQDRIRIELMLDQEESIRAIAVRLGRAPSTISREVGRHRDRRGQYIATRAQRLAWEAAARPQPLKLGVGTVHVRLRARVVTDLVASRSPEQISARLEAEFGTDPATHQGMNVAPETIYRALFLQARGGLKREVEMQLRAQREAEQTATPDKILRTGRTARKARTASRTTGPGQIPDMISIHDRPPVTDTDGHWLPGHHEGDLILGKNGISAIGTIVERATGYLWLLHLPYGHTATAVREAITQQLHHWPEVLKQTITWDRGKELTQHRQLTIDTGLQVYFADPRSPWQRAGNENINGLLRQYFPKGTDLSIHTAAELQRVANQMNDRPRKRLGYAKPVELISELVLH
jgi:IS30 family transposase